MNEHLMERRPTVRLAVGHPGPGVGVVGVPLRVQVVEEHVHLVLGQQGGHGLHVVVAQAVVVSVRVLAVQDGVVVRHPPGLVGRCDFHGELCGLSSSLLLSSPLFSSLLLCGSVSSSTSTQEKPKKRCFS